MKVMILAAGRGKRLSPLTDRTPKPLVEVGGKALIDYHIEGLVEAGFSQIVINLGYLGSQIREHCEQRHGGQIEIIFSIEQPEPLETGGGIFQALPLLGDDPFIVINADIWTNFPFKRLRDYRISTDLTGHLVLVDNPEHNQAGDFSLHEWRSEPP